MTRELSKGSLMTIMSGGQLEDVVLQVIGIKKIANSGNSDKERYRLLLSDSVHFISHAMFTTTYNDKNNNIPVNSIILIKKYITSLIGDKAKGQRRILVILDMEILVSGNEVGSKIGEPQDLSDDVLAAISEESSSNGHAAPPKPKPTPAPAMNQPDMNQTILSEQLTHPISSLSPYQNKWVIKVRVTNKSTIRTWSNSRGEGKLFSMDLVDESGEIRATAFNNMVDKYYEMIEVDKVYYISKCQLKPANKQYTSLKNDYEMSFSNETLVQPCFDEASSIPQTQYNFVPISKLENAESNSMHDIIGICKSAGELQTFTARSSGRELKKKEVVLVDSSNCSINLTLWGTEAEKFDPTGNPVIVIKGAKLGEFQGGKSISTVSSSVMKINPDIPDAHRITGWFENSNVGNITNLSSTTGGGSFAANWMCFQEVLNKNLGQTEKGDFYQTKATILLIRSENALYKACPTEGCNKKIVDMENGMYRCEKCNREFPNFKYRLLISMNLGDWSKNQWVSLFSDDAEKIFGKSAQQIGEEKDVDPESLTNLCDANHFKEFIFKCKAKMETYNDETRLKTVAFKVEPINYKEYNAQILKRIDFLLTN